jgi:replicative DNA helicase
VSPALVVHVTAGAGKKEPQGRAVTVPGGVEGLARWLNERKPEGANTWWSVHTFRDGYRAVQPTKANGWRGGWERACAVGVDVDYCGVSADDARHHNAKGEDAHTHDPLPAELVVRLDELARRGDLPGNLYHRTRCGFRLVFVFEAECDDARAYELAARAVDELVADALRDTELAGCPGLHVDPAVSQDRARVLWAPRGPCEGEEKPRNAEVLVLRSEPYPVASLRPRPSAPPPRHEADEGGRVLPLHTDLADAVQRYNGDRSREIPRSSGRCPVCEHEGCFGRLPEASDRWSCFSAQHPEVGVPPSTAGAPWTGDVLDLDTFERFRRTGDAHKRARVELLRGAGYLAPRHERAAPPPRSTAAGGAAPAHVTEPANEENPKPKPKPKAKPAPSPVADGVRESLERVRRRRDREEVPLPVPWPGLAAELGGGLWPGTFALLVGNTGAGKSQWAMQLAWRVANAGNPVLYVSLEVDRYSMHCRALALAARDLDAANAPKWSALYYGEVSGEELALAERAADRVESHRHFRLEVGSPSGWDYMRLRELVASVRESHPGKPVLVVLDYLQLVDGAGAEEDELRLRMKRAVAEGQSLAMDEAHPTAVLFLSSTARTNYGALAGTADPGTSGDTKGKDRRKGATIPLGKGDPSRFVGTGKESGDLEFTASTVLVLAKEPWGEEGPPSGGTHVWLAVAKGRARSRHARDGWVALRFDGSCFYEPGTGDDPGRFEA